MDNKTRNLLRRIQELEDGHAHLEQQILNLAAVYRRRNLTTLAGASSSTRQCPLRRGSGVKELTEAQYFNILQSIDQPIQITDDKGCFIYRNPAWEKFYGYSKAETIGKDVCELMLEEKDVEGGKLLMRELLLTGDSWSGEVVLRYRKGEKVASFGETTPFRDENGAIIGLIGESVPRLPYKEPSVPAPTNIDPYQGPVQSDLENILSCSSDCNKHSIFKIISTKAECLVKNGIALPLKEVKSQPCVNTKTTLSQLSSSLDRVYEIKWEDLKIRERIGRGSRGAVYHAVWNGSDVALKLFPKNEYSPDLILSFKQEVYLMKRLRHPNIILFMGSLTTPHHLCIVTEFLRRGSLFQLLQRNTVVLKWRHRVHMGMDIARGMNYLHHCRPPIIHCNLKSTNLLVDKNWTVKIGNFGMCRLKHETYVTTKEGIGAPEWMAPEVIRDEEANEKSDVYSFGVILWELATEKVPWNGLNSMQVMKAVGFMNQRLDIPKDVDPQWASLIERCLRSVPESRPTFEDILVELKDLQKKFTIKVEASSLPLVSSKIGLQIQI